MTDDAPSSPLICIHPLIAKRWSPRSLDINSQVSSEQLLAIMEAGRWAATWAAQQPVRFIAGLRDDPTFIALSALLSEGNKSW
ncbi:MAG: nitroreductase family protein, partial [Mycobacteriaceae bacterium]